MFYGKAPSKGEIYMKKTILVLVMGFYFAASSAMACMSAVSEKKLFDVEVLGVHDIKMQTGDMVRVQATYPVVPKYLNSKLTLDYDSKVLFFVKETSYSKEMQAQYPDPIVGSGGNVFYFRAVQPGNTTITIRRQDKQSGEAIEEKSQNLEVRERPLKRGC